MSFKSFFKGMFGGTAKIVDCLTSWNKQYCLLFCKNRFPPLVKSWWTSFFKYPSIKAWWDNIACLQKILYIVLVFIMSGFIIAILYFGSDIFLDFEDIGLLFEGIFGPVYDVLQLGLEWTVVFASFFFMTANPVYHFLSAVGESLKIGPLPLYIIIFQSMTIILLFIYKHIYGDIVKAGTKNPIIAKIFKVLDWPLKFVTDTFGRIFGTYATIFFDVLFFPIRALLVFVDILIDQAKF